METTTNRSMSVSLGDGRKQPVRGQIKRIDLASTGGAGILGVGLGLLLGEYLNGAGAYAIALIAVGLVLHGWAMTQRHRLDALAARVWWSEALYWLCWVALALIAILVVIRIW